MKKLFSTIIIAAALTSPTQANDDDTVDYWVKTINGLLTCQAYTLDMGRRSINEAKRWHNRGYSMERFNRALIEKMTGEPVTDEFYKEILSDRIEQYVKLTVAKQMGVADNCAKDFQTADQSCASRECLFPEAEVE